MDNSNIHPDTSSFRNQNLRGRDFSNWNIQNADFTNAKLEGTDFTNAKLEGANFTNARLEGANFKDADLKKVNFEGIKTGVKTYWAFWSKIISWLLAAIAGGYTGYIGS
ncbi:MAG: pentapeptide repeat-containing protein, partial [Cyanobacteria bacterium P01_A01_bin.123]